MSLCLVLPVTTWFLYIDLRCLLRKKLEILKLLSFALCVSFNFFENTNTIKIT